MLCQGVEQEQASLGAIRSCLDRPQPAAPLTAKQRHGVVQQGPLHHGIDGGPRGDDLDELRLEQLLAVKLRTACGQRSGAGAGVRCVGQAGPRGMACLLGVAHYQRTQNQPHASCCCKRAAWAGADGQFGSSCKERPPQSR